MSSGKVYKLFNETAPDVFYIGSTFRPLSYRLSAHKNDYLQFLKGRRDNKISAFAIVSSGPFNRLKIELLEDVPDGIDIKVREAYHINLAKQQGGNIVNKNTPGRTAKQYYEDNRESILNTVREYYQLNRERILEKAHQRKIKAQINIQVNINESE